PSERAAPTDPAPAGDEINHVSRASAASAQREPSEDSGPRGYLLDPMLPLDPGSRSRATTVRKNLARALARPGHATRPNITPPLAPVAAPPRSISMQWCKSSWSLRASAR